MNVGKNAANVGQTWNNFCLPAKIYIVVMVAVVIFDMYLGSLKNVLSNTISLFVGSILLWTLCAAKLEFVAYSLMWLPVLFFLFLFAIIVYDQSVLNIRSKNACGVKKCKEKPKKICPEKCPKSTCCEKPKCDCA